LQGKGDERRRRAEEEEGGYKLRGSFPCALLGLDAFAPGLCVQQGESVTHDMMLLAYYHASMHESHGGESSGLEIFETLFE
jgi:hypothetical protein